jgi:hypothetical protein
VIIVTNALKQFITWNLKDEFLPCEASALFLQVSLVHSMKYFCWPGAGEVCSPVVSVP